MRQLSTLEAAYYYPIGPGGTAWTQEHVSDWVKAYRVIPVVAVINYLINWCN